MSYPSWWSSQSVVEEEIATPASFKALESALQLADQLEIRTLLIFTSSCCLDFGITVGPFFNKFVLLFLRQQTKHIPPQQLFFFNFASFRNVWMTVFCASDIFFNSCHLWYWVTIYWTLKVLLFLCQYFDTEKTHETTWYVNA